MRRKKFIPPNKSSQNENRINEQIRVPQVRVIGVDGEQLGVISIQEALQRAEALTLDLVEVSPNADPPVCKLMDYGKFRYQQQKRAHEAKKKQAVVQLKEVKVRPKIDEHDYQFKLKHVMRFLEDGDKAKLTVVFRGREIVHREIGEKLLARFIDDVKDIGDVEAAPKMEGRNLMAILTAKSQKPPKQTVKVEPSQENESVKEEG
ncbi:translation initiation factor IF-3 [Candidatus Moduliflexus flocculans]|uniref:Translation initiation factor IF-3 n=1 Tax=Candidatus Moduliflexus flocculans TaxID=1499966 RepID=A0A081BSX4_9BACT|nr:translation initiation factor IF-3 [Candidatus Moduliflexus flocculans]